MVSKFNSLYAPAFFATAIDHSLSMFPSIFLQKCQGKLPKDPRPMGSSAVTGSVVVVVVVADVVVAVVVRGEHTTCLKPLCHFHQVGWTSLVPCEGLKLKDLELYIGDPSNFLDFDSDGWFESRWWFQPHLKNMSQIRSFPQIGVKIKNVETTT